MSMDIREIPTIFFLSKCHEALASSN